MLYFRASRISAGFLGLALIVLLALLLSTVRVAGRPAPPSKKKDAKDDKKSGLLLDVKAELKDTFLRVLDSKFRKLAEDDDSGGGNNGTDSQLSFTPDADGEYHIIASSFDGNTGEFRLAIREEK